MVLVIHNCDCGNCPGTKPPENHSRADIVFGGTVCNCRCHESREDLREMIETKQQLEEIKNKKCHILQNKEENNY